MVHVFQEDKRPEVDTCMVCRMPKVSLRHYHTYQKAKDAEPEGSITKCICSGPMVSATHENTRSQLLKEGG